MKTRFIHYRKTYSIVYTIGNAGYSQKARQELESKTGKKVVTGESFLPSSLKKQLAKKL